MWATTHSPTSSRSSAKNIDLRSASIDENAIERKSFPLNVEMWMTKDQGRSRTPSIQSSNSGFISNLSRQSSAVMEESEQADPRARSKPYELLKHVVSSKESSYEQQSPYPAELMERVVHRPIEAQQQSELPHAPSVSGMTDASHSTLAEDFPELENDMKTPIVISHPVDTSTMEVAEIPEPSTPPIEVEMLPKGPLELQLLNLLSKVSALEREQPTIMASDYQCLENRLAESEAKNLALQQRYEALFAIRDEDVANLVKVRSLLGQERREHDATRKLRDEDLQNVIDLRNKLAHETWSLARESPATTPGKHPNPKRLSQSTDLWLAAKTAAMEQKVLELERANTDLRSQLDHAHTALLKSSQQPQAKVADRNTSLSDTETGLGAMFEGALRHRERYIVKIERLRAENDDLRRELGRKEDETADLEHTIEKLRMKIELGRSL